MMTKTCKICGLFSYNANSIEANFGYFLNKKRKYVQSQCKNCRRQKRPSKRVILCD